MRLRVGKRAGVCATWSAVVRRDEHEGSQPQCPADIADHGERIERSINGGQTAALIAEYLLPLLHVQRDPHLSALRCGDRRATYGAAVRATNYAW
jgi:hypothetical protein